jgi:hypothetical protein
MKKEKKSTKTKTISKREDATKDDTKNSQNQFVEVLKSGTTNLKNYNRAYLAAASRPHF